MSGLEENHHALVLGAHPGLDDQARELRRVWDLEQASMIRNGTIQEFRSRWETMPLLRRVVPDNEEDVARLQSGRGKLTVEGLAWAMTHLGAGAMLDVKESLLSGRIT